MECLKQQCPNIEGCYALLDPRDDECCHKCTGKTLVRPTANSSNYPNHSNCLELGRAATGVEKRKREYVVVVVVGAARRGGKKERRKLAECSAGAAEHCSLGTKALLFADMMINPRNFSVTVSRGCLCLRNVTDRCVVLVIVHY